MLCSARRGILGSRRAQCSLLCISRRYRSGTSRWKFHRRRVLPSGRVDVRSETGPQDHLYCPAYNQPCSDLVGSSAWGYAETATDCPMPQERRRSLTQWPLLSPGIQPLTTGSGPQRQILRGRVNGGPVRAGAAHVPSGTGFWYRCHLHQTPPLGGLQRALGWYSMPLFDRRPGSFSDLCWVSVPLREGGRRRFRRIPFCHRLGTRPGNILGRK